MEEIWKDVPGYEGLYKVNENCEILSFKRKTSRILKPSPGGYNKKHLYVALSKNGKLKFRTIYDIGWEAFNGPIPSDCVIHHIDGNTLNNNIANLECMQRSEHSALENSKPCKQLDLNGNVIKEWKSAADAARAYCTGIYNCLTGRAYSSKGYIWIY